MASYRKNKDMLIFTDGLNLIRLYADNVTIKNFSSRFKTNKAIVYNRTIGFALIQCKYFCPIQVLNAPYCLDFIYIDENQRVKGQGRRLLKFIRDHFQKVVHALPKSLGSFEHINKDMGLEGIKT